MTHGQKIAKELLNRKPDSIAFLLAYYFVNLPKKVAEARGEKQS